MVTIRRLLPWVIGGTIFLQGLYFNPLMLGALVVSLMLLFYSCIKEKSIKIPKDKGFYFFIFFFGAHLMGYVFFLERGMLLFEILRSLLFIVFYILIAQFYNDKFMIRFKKSIVYMSVFGSVLSLSAYFLDFFPSLNYVIKGRLAGPLQYANTNGILLLIALLFLFTLELKRIIRIPMALLLLIPMLLTMSRSTMLFALLAIVLYLIFIKRDKETFILFGTSIIVSVLFVMVFDQGDAMLRLSESNLGVSEWQTRMLYYEDAVQIIAKRPMGYGPYGYYYVQRAFQTGSTYYVKLVHSSLLQYFLDLGLVGGLLFAAFGVYVVIFRRISPFARICLALLLGHSLIDIDMAYALIWLIIIVLMYDGRSTKFYELKVEKQMKAFGYSCLILLVLVGLYGLIVEMTFASKSYATAYNLYPYHTEAMRHDLGKLERPEDNLAIAERLVRHQPYISKSYKVLYNDAMIDGRIDEGLTHARTLVNLNVLNIEYYEVLASTLRIYGETQILDGNVAEARLAFEEIARMPETLEQLAKEKKTHYNVKHVPSLTMTNELVGHYLVAKQWLETLER